MSRVKRGQPDPDTINKRINKRHRAQQQRPIIDLAISLIGQNLTPKEIRAQLATKFGKGYRQNQRYYKMALEALEDVYNADLKDIRNTHIAGIDSDIKEAYSNYKAAVQPYMKCRWFEIYQGCKREKKTLFINDLAPVDDGSTAQKIEITYKKVGE